MSSTNSNDLKVRDWATDTQNSSSPPQSPRVPLYEGSHRSGVSKDAQSGQAPGWDVPSPESQNGHNPAWRKQNTDAHSGQAPAWKHPTPETHSISSIPTIIEEPRHRDLKSKTSSQGVAEHLEYRTRSPKAMHRSQTLSTMRSTIGLDAESPIAEGHDVHQHLTWSGIRVILREPFAEFFGVFIMILFGDGSVAQVTLSNAAFSAGAAGDYQSINWAWGLGVMLGIYVAGDSGAFLNPAVMFGFCLFRGFPWKRFPIYFVAQLLGAFCGSGIVYANYISAIDQKEGHGIRTVPGYSKTATAGIFCTYPQPFLTKASQFFSEFIASTILMFVIFALKDESNQGAMGKSGAGKLFPLALLFLIFGLGSCFGWETGYAINLVRDFGPRLMSYFIGYGHEVWSAGGYYFWIPMVAPFFGCTFGGFLYDVFIYTGPETPINKPYWGFKALFQGLFSSHRKPESVKEKGDDDIV